DPPQAAVRRDHRQRPGMGPDQGGAGGDVRRGERAGLRARRYPVREDGGGARWVRRTGGEAERDPARAGAGLRLRRPGLYQRPDRCTADEANVLSRVAGVRADDEFSREREPRRRRRPPKAKTPRTERAAVKEFMKTRSGVEAYVEPQTLDQG